MYKRLREPFGKAGLIVAAIALIFALTGGALAATGNNPLASSSKAKQGKQGKQGKPGKPGPKGDTGAPGAPGTNGTNGKDGTNGTNGTNGAPGADGKSVVLTTEPAGTNCPAVGGTKVEVEGNAASKKYVCNGKNGTTGFTDTLPPGKTETGTWSALLAPGHEVFLPAVITTISFPIPLLEAGTKAYVFSKADTSAEEFGTSGCAGTAAEPTAPPGTLCVYTSYEYLEGTQGTLEALSPDPAGEAGYGVSGARLFGLTLEAESTVEILGTWAVTAPEA